MVFNKLKNLFSGGDKKPVTYEEARVMLSKGNKKDRLLLAQQKDARPEVLYYLADDKDPDVRAKIASNPATPVQADTLLSKDESEEVRLELARKIGRIVPDMDPSDQEVLQETTIEILEDLAKDQEPKIRSLIADAIKHLEAIPKDIVTKLAKDVEDVVCGPILQYSPLLNDDDLREIIAAGTSSGALKAIAERAGLSQDVSDDVVSSLDVPAIAALLTNEKAQIREDTLDRIIDQASSVEELHKPLALRPQLSIRAMKRIAGFVASALVFAMMEQSTLEEDLAEDILEKVRERVEGERLEQSEEMAIAKQARDFMDRGLLDDAFIVKQVEESNRELIIQCLALMADLSSKIVRKIILSKSGRAVTALSWRAQLKMRTAYAIQTKLALVPSAQLLHGKGGEKYPIDEDELDWHLSYFIDQAD
ncbi:DUF2336 domain-containing protein [Temperatibacter marinus]|uniref:DUF2336 domain-containing protein n=1 Tax=Temperatibacter marinus TaxID=1456591 RepID=A0AA52EGV0_9PROT|nr:DUF2336 domain-containing protein [Temperatibacter marinus]WND03418.1 DUF2336 domain-containing protein [Temperatibacter marinus]